MIDLKPEFIARKEYSPGTWIVGWVFTDAEAGEKTMREAANKLARRDFDTAPVHRCSKCGGPLGENFVWVMGGDNSGRFHHECRPPRSPARRTPEPAP